MKLRNFVYIWLLIVAAMSYDYLILNKVIKGQALLPTFLCKVLRECAPLSPIPGRPLSFWLGWIGFCVMALTNLYVLRKRMHSLQRYGNLQNWLNWHIFFGLLGPTFIVFHANFKVGGLVSIAFWSMVVSFASGVVGRYIYMQLLQGKGSLKQKIEMLEKAFDQYQQGSGNRIQPQAMLAAKAYAFAMAGGIPGPELKNTGIVGFLMRSTLGGMRMAFSLPPTPWVESRAFKVKLKEWAILRRRLISMHYYQILFGYWRTFHTPFAVWMYIVAVIHIVSSLIFMVPN
jgi:hypothetical protein